MRAFKLFLLQVVLVGQFIVVSDPVMAIPEPSRPQCIDAIDIDNNCEMFDDRPFDCAVGTDGTVNTVWVSAGNVYYSRGTADLQTWTAPQKITFIILPNTNAPNPAVAIVCENNTVHLIITNSKRLSHFQSSDYGKTWLELSAVRPPEIGRWGTTIRKIMKPFIVNHDLFVIHLLLENGKEKYQWILDRWNSSGAVTSVKLTDCEFYPPEAVLTVKDGKLYLAYWSNLHKAALSTSSLPDGEDTKTWTFDQPQYDGDSILGAQIWVRDDTICLFYGNDVIVCPKNCPEKSSKITISALKHSKDNATLRALSLLPVDERSCLLFWISARYEKAYRNPLENGKELRGDLKDGALDELGFIPLPILVPMLGLALLEKKPFTNDIVMAEVAGDKNMQIKSVRRITEPNYFCYAPVVCKQGNSILVFWTARMSLRNKVNNGPKKLFVAKLSM